MILAQTKHSRGIKKEETDLRKESNRKLHICLIMYLNDDLLDVTPQSKPEEKCNIETS